MDPTVQELEQSAETLRELQHSLAHYGDAVLLLSAIADKIAQADQDDQCYGCIKEQIIGSLETFFHYSGLSIRSAIEVLQYRGDEYRCQEHQ